MNNKKRLDFWNDLDKPINEIDLMKFEKYIPKYLYRYRKADSTSLAALLNNRLYFSTSNYYDDPFDTLFCIDKAKLKNEVNILLTNLNAKLEFNHFQEMLNKKFDFDMDYVIRNKEEIFKTIDKIINIIQYSFKKEIYSICFSENDLNQDLWLKYADNYAGFVIKYDVENLKKSYDKTYNKDDELIKNNKSYLYPIVYDNKPFYANELFKNIVLNAVNLEKYIDDLNRYLIDRRRVCLIKDKYHSNDKEWRLFVDNNPFYINVVPKAVIMGLKISKSDRELLFKICQENRIDLYQTYISDDYKFKKKSIVKFN